MQRRTAYISIIAGILFTALPISAPVALRAEVIISEIMYDPQNTDTNREWVEIFNTGISAVNIGGWQFGLPSLNDWANALPANTMLGAGQALVLTPSSATLDSDWGSGINRLQVGNFPALDNDPNPTPNAATVAIRNGSGVIQDQLTYEDGSGWPTTNGNDGNSIYVLPQYLTSSLNNSGSNWKPSSQGVYGAVWKSAGGDSENHASPGTVATTVQTPFVPSSDAAWSMVYLPDVQNYNSSDGDQAREIGQMNWIINNKAAFNIKAVIQGGDIVNQNDTPSQWARAKEAFNMLNGQVPYILAAGNHDFGNNNFENRNTQYNNYFKVTDNPLNNPATGGIIKGTYETSGSAQFTHLENSYSTFTAPDGRKMLIFNVEFYPRQAVLDWANSIAGQAQYADYTALLLTHAFIDSGATRWNAAANEFPGIEGNDGVDMWNELVKVNGNFQMTYNGHFGGDGNSFREDPNDAGVDVHQIFLDTQWETNGGNGWMQVVEFLKDGQGVRVRTYSPHFDLYRTNAASNLNFDLTHVDSPLIWNTGADSFSNGFARGNGSQGVGVTACDPYGAGGKEDLIVGFGGVASITGSASRTIASLRVGTNAANAFISGHNGNGTVSVGNSTNLTLSTSTGTGDLTIGEGGYTGTFNWNSTGTLTAQGKLRIGQGGIGVFNQTAGVVIGGNTAGTLKFIGIGVNAGSQGTYNLNGGTLRPSGGFAGTEFRQTAVGDAGASGELNVGDGVGAANSAAIESNDDLYIGRADGIGLMRVRSDGRVELRTSSNAAEFFVGQDSTGTVIQTGGTVMSDNTVRIGSEPGGVGQYTISAGLLSTATDGTGTFTIGRNGGIGTLRIEGTGQFAHDAELFIGDVSNSGTSGRLEIIGSTASVQIGQLENGAGGASGVREAILWQASAAGVTPLVVTGDGPLASTRVQLQDAADLAANTGTNGSGNLSGDGIALELNLSAIATSGFITLIDNRTIDAITGFFENGTTKNLYEEGEIIPLTGFDGTVTISYHGGTGNDVTLTLAALLGDHNRDGVVDTADYIVWRKTGINGQQGYDDWRANFGKSAPSFGLAAPGESSSTSIPEPMAATSLLIGFFALALCQIRSRPERLANLLLRTQ
jgi:hypothetical protein